MRAFVLPASKRRWYKRRMNERDPELARRYGWVLMAAAGTSALAYLVALMRRSYWATALPVSVMTFGLLAGAGLLGRLLATTPDEPPSP